MNQTQIKSLSNQIKTKIPGKFLTQKLPGILVSTGLLLILLAATHWYSRLRSLSLSQELIAQHQQQQPTDQDNIPTHIYIQWFVDVGVEETVYQDKTWTISESKASYLAQSARPGQPGNIIIYGHNKRSILGNIRALKGSEIITLTTKNGQEHRYQVDLIQEVHPTQTKFLEPTSEEVLTLYTCSGLLDRNRFIVRAKPIKL
ncbi:MAG: sortase [Candidatus Pacebacteria bacterium]|nr:sortase [Candidatus Paceibacterota bacterium]